MRNQNQSVRTFVATDPKIVVMSTTEHKQDIFNSINANKVNIDRKVFVQEDKDLIKKFKGSVKQAFTPKKFNSLYQLKSLLPR